MSKNLFFLSILMLWASSGFGQGTLSFADVIMVDATPQTVPTGKIWKVESAMGPHTEGTSYTNVATPVFPSAHNIIINSQTIGVGTMDSSLGFTSSSSGSRVTHMARSTVTTFPIWLPEGSTLAAGSNVTYVSVIEFDVIP